MSWVGVWQNQLDWKARRLELRSLCDLVFLAFRLHCVSSAYSSLCPLTLLWAPRGWPLCLQAVGQRKSLVGDKERKGRPEYLFHWVLHCNTAFTGGLGYCPFPHTFCVLLGSGNPSFIFSGQGEGTTHYQYYSLWFPFAHTSQYTESLD